MELKFGSTMDKEILPPSNNKIEFAFTDMQFREFSVVDVDNDGWPDIVLDPF